MLSWLNKKHVLIFVFSLLFSFSFLLFSPAKILAGTCGKASQDVVTGCSINDKVGGVCVPETTKVFKDCSDSVTGHIGSCVYLQYTDSCNSSCKRVPDPSGGEYVACGGGGGGSGGGCPDGYHKETSCKKTCSASDRSGSCTLGNGDAGYKCKSCVKDPCTAPQITSITRDPADDRRVTVNWIPGDPTISENTQSIFIGKNKANVESNCVSNPAGCVVKSTGLAFDTTSRENIASNPLADGSVYYIRVLSEECNLASTTKRYLSNCRINPISMIANSTTSLPTGVLASYLNEILKVNYSSSNTSVFSVSPASDTTYPYSTNVNSGAAAGSATATSNVYFGTPTQLACSYSANVTVSAATPTASCSVSPNPIANGGNPGITLNSTNAAYCFVYHDGALVNVGYFNSGTFYPGAQTIPGNHQGQVYCYNSNWVGSGWNTCNYTVGNAPVNGSCAVDHYNCSAGTSINNAEGASSYTWTCQGANNGTNASCSQTKSLTAWWQVKDSDVGTNEDLISHVPSGNYFGLFGGGGFPGVPVFAGSTNLSNLNASASPYGWIANTTMNTSKVYDSGFFENQIPSDIVLNTVDTADVASSLTSGGTPDSHGYYWYKYDGTTTGDLNTTSAINLGSRKIILIVDSANFNINGNINLTDGQGFFMAIVNGNIVVAPTVGDLEGIYEADNQFQTGAASSQLHVRGNVVAYGGVALQRDLGTNNTTTPSELFEYAPDQIMLYPKALSARKINWKEVAP